MSVQVSPNNPSSDLASKFSKDAYAVNVAELSRSPSPNQRFLIQSPYTEQEHLLDLNTLDNENALLARALVKLEKIREDYAIAPYNDSFNWPVVFEELRRIAVESGKGFKKTDFYIVAFRSQIKPETDYSHLGDLDKAAHGEAIESGGFLKYWFGSPDPELRNLATCLWRSKEDAYAGGRGPAHRKAAMSTRALYQYWKIDQHRLTIENNAESWSITTWED